jgi:hypothetical protein
LGAAVFLIFVFFATRIIHLSAGNTRDARGFCLKTGQKPSP